MTEWETVKLGDVAEIIMGQSPPGETCNKNKLGTPLLNGPTEYGSHHPFPVQYTTDPKKISKKNDILYCVRGSTTGRMNWSDQEYAIGRGVAALRHKSGPELNIIVKSLLEVENPNLLAASTGSTFPNVSRDQLSEIEITLPPLPIQKQIAKVLGDLDDKIELNRRMNETLEEMAMAIYKHYFVDFGLPPGAKDEATECPFGKLVEHPEMGMIPEGWKVYPLDKIANFLNGLAMQKFPPKGNEFLPVIKIREMRQGITDSSDKASIDIEKKYIIEPGDILFSWSGSLDVVLWFDKKGALNQHLFKVESDQFPKWLCYLTLKYVLPEFQKIASDKATTMGHIQRHHLSDTLIVIPQADIYDSLDNELEPIIAEIISNNKEIKSLTETRDYLLPKLLSGEVRVG